MQGTAPAAVAVAQFYEEKTKLGRHLAAAGPGESSSGGHYA